MSTPPFTCPQCGSHFFGADPATGRVRCHGSGSVSLPEFAAGKRQTLCDWSGPWPPPPSPAPQSAIRNRK